ncbi:hypothetical protein WJX72_011319 [[Myrmecia] bisecta]|uniref:HECT-type E3 ubiquitin transferase n=1 Tax=[Myrmecia] bisecta TaxID=41462 RepID=A0AAW1R9U0_9CHLO
MHGQDDLQASGRSKLQDAKKEFEDLVLKHFNTVVRTTGLPPNEAAAMALKIAAGAVRPPVDVASLAQQLSDYKTQGITSLSYQQIAPILGGMKELFLSAETLSMSFMTCPTSQDQGQDLNAQLSTAVALFEQTMPLPDGTIIESVAAFAEPMLKQLKNAGSAVSPEHRMRAALIMLQLPFLDDPEHHGLFSMISETLSALPSSSRDEVVRVFSRLDARGMESLVEKTQQFITIHLYEEQMIDEEIEDAVKLLDLAYRANKTSKAIGFVDFYNDAVNHEDFNLREDYMRWKHPGRYKFSFCAYPFIFDPATKSQILQLENTKEQFEEFHEAMIRQLLSGHGLGACPYLILKVRRSPYLVHDTLLQIQGAAARDALKKPLKVQFIGEEGVDEGGVQKEFFQLLMRDLFDANYGMFTYDEDTRLYWFRPSQIDMSMEFELVGIMLGLAIYNSHILEFSFPMLTYRKLMGHQATFEDLRELHPDIYTSLKKLLEFSGSVEDMGLFFQVEQAGSFGAEMETIDLLPDGGSIAVTAANRQQYVELYTQHLLSTSIEPQFSAFQRGFNKLCGGPALQMFQPEELELLICGGRELDFQALESRTVYDDGYTTSSEVIQWFWSVVHGLPDDQKKRLLFFVTGSDRVPIKGLASLTPPFVISRNGPHSERLPTAHTCFNHLLLPQYKDRATLESRLITAISNAEGFGLR